MKKNQFIEKCLDNPLFYENTASSIQEVRLLEKVCGAILEFNKYRSPEANVSLIEIKDKENKNKEKSKLKRKIYLDFLFTGHFCFTCGYYDYFEDFLYMLADNNLKVKIEKIKEIEYGAIVTFSVNI